MVCNGSGDIFLTLFWGRNIYCSWLCPFGAVQEGIYKALNLGDYKPNPKLIMPSRKSRWFFLWLAALMALVFNNPGIAGFEPFHVFFDGDGNTSQWLMMGFILLFAIFLLRFWCRLFCPVGTFLDFTALCKRKIKRFLTKKSEADKKTTATACQENCFSCSGEKTEEMQFTNGDKAVAVGIFIVWVLILGALVQNLELF